MTRKQQGRVTMQNQSLIADHLSEERLTAIGALGMMTGPEPPPELARASKRKKLATSGSAEPKGSRTWFNE
jgi:hypothetical protein